MATLGLQKLVLKISMLRYRLRITCECYHKCELNSEAEAFCVQYYWCKLHSCHVFLILQYDKIIQACWYKFL